MSREPGGDIDWTIVDRFLAGESTPDEPERVHAWARTDPRLAELLSAASGPSTANAESPREWSTDAAWARLRAERPELAPPSASRAPIVWRVAASMLVTALALGWWLNRQRGSRSASAPAAVIAARGQRVTVRLADGSRVVLAPDSRLTPAPGFADANRIVTLTGRAFFDVVHDSTRPFTVIAGGTRVRDVGTAFEVDAYGPRSRVIVTAGTVLLETAGGRPTPGTTVTAGQLARIDSDGSAVVDPRTDVAPLVSWTAGDLEFHQAVLRDVIAELDRWYDVDIAVSDSGLMRRHITGTFHDEPLPLVLHSIGLILHAKYQINGHSISLTSK